MKSYIALVKGIHYAGMDIPRGGEFNADPEKVAHQLAMGHIAEAAPPPKPKRRKTEQPPTEAAFSLPEDEPDHRPFADEG